MTPDEKYRNDSKYHEVVAMIRSFLSTYEMTPSELREAVMLACTMHEMETLRPIMYPKVTWYPVNPKPKENGGGG